jgi:uncharacterized Zn-binding protein involved in type VI secretion
MPRVARITDTGSHGGQIVTGSDTVTADGLKVARVGDMYACPIHGMNPIIEGSGAYTADGKKVARIGDATQCGAVITSGSPTHTDGG